MNPDRRKFLRKGAYVAPTVLTLTAMPSFARNGSRKPRRRRRDYDGSDKSWKSAKSEKSGKSEKSSKSEKDD